MSNMQVSNIWHIREPSGLTKDHLLEADRQEFLHGDIYELSYMQTASMDSGVVEWGLQCVLDGLTDVLKDDFQRASLHQAKKTLEISSFFELKERLHRASADIQSPWYWDGLFAVIFANDLKIVLQPECDGTDIACYIAGRDAQKQFNALRKCIDERLQKVAQNTGFVPQEIQALATKHHATLQVLSPPTQGKTHAHLRFATIRIVSGDTELDVELLCNTSNSSGWQISAVVISEAKFCDESPEALLAIIAAVFLGGIHKKRSIFGRKKLYVVDAAGQTHWPRS